MPRVDVVPQVKVCKKFNCAGPKCFKTVKALEEPCKMEQNFCEVRLN